MTEISAGLLLRASYPISTDNENYSKPYLKIFLVIADLPKKFCTIAITSHPVYASTIYIHIFLNLNNDVMLKLISMFSR